MKKNKGAAGNDIDIRVNYLGARSGEMLPAGVGVTIVPMSGGVTNPSLPTGLSNLAELSFDFIVSAYTDSVSTTAISVAPASSPVSYARRRKSRSARVPSTPK